MIILPKWLMKLLENEEHNPTGDTTWQSYEYIISDCNQNWNVLVFIHRKMTIFIQIAKACGNH